MTDREQALESALKTLWGELSGAHLRHPEFTELFYKTDRRLRELGVLPPVYTKAAQADKA